MYRISNCSGKIYKEDVPIDGDSALMAEYKEYLQAGGTLSFFDGTVEEMAAVKISRHITAIQSLVSDLRHLAMCVAIDKHGDPSYIRTQRELYEKKYRRSILNPMPADVFESFQGEATEFGISIGYPDLSVAQFLALIQFKYLEGEECFDNLCSFIERGRTKIQTLAENGQDELVEIATYLFPGVVNKIDGTTVLSQILDL